MRWSAVVPALVLLVGTMTSCGDDTTSSDDPPAPVATGPAPGPGFCDDLAAAAGSGPWTVEELPDEDRGSLSCTFARAGYRADMAVRYGDLARKQFERTLGELEDSGFPGFVDPVVTRPTGWWSEGYRLESVVPGVARIVELVNSDDLTVRLLLVGSPVTGYPDAQEDEARSLVDAFLDAVPAVLEG